MKKSKIDFTMLYQLYVKDGLSTRDCAIHLGVGKSTVHKELVKKGWNTNRQPLRDDYGRYIRKGQILPPQEGENSPAYKDGSSIYRKICELYHPKLCFHCGKLHDLHVHHLDRDRTNNHFWNLRWVCGSCHMRIEHRDRLYKRDEKGRFI